MKIAMMAAGVGSRLDPSGDRPPKILLQFRGKTLLQRHLEMLRAEGIDDLTIIVGHRADLIERRLQELGAGDWVQTRFNPDYEHSSILSLWCLRDMFRAGQPVIYMDADVLYDHRIMTKLADEPTSSCLLVDSQQELNDEALKVCIQNGKVVDFHKQIKTRSYDQIAEWVGFARFSPDHACRLADMTERYVQSGKIDVIYEEPIRDVILQAQKGAFGCVDVAGLPWIEIDFPEDLRRAIDEILPRLQDRPDVASDTH